MLPPGRTRGVNQHVLLFPASRRIEPHIRSCFILRTPDSVKCQSLARANHPPTSGPPRSNCTWYKTFYLEPRSPWENNYGESSNSKLKDGFMRKINWTLNSLRQSYSLRRPFIPKRDEEGSYLLTNCLPFRICKNICRSKR